MCVAGARRGNYFTREISCCKVVSVQQQRITWTILTLNGKPQIQCLIVPCCFRRWFSVAMGLRSPGQTRTTCFSGGRGPVTCVALRARVETRQTLKWHATGSTGETPVEAWVLVVQTVSKLLKNTTMVTRSTPSDSAAFHIVVSEPRNDILALEVRALVITLATVLQYTSLWWRANASNVSVPNLSRW